MAKRKDPTIERCPWHKRKLGYLQWHEDADKRAARGEKQRQCEACGLWFFDHEYGTPPRAPHTAETSEAITHHKDG